MGGCSISFWRRLGSIKKNLDSQFTHTLKRLHHRKLSEFLRGSARVRQAGIFCTLKHKQQIANWCYVKIKLLRILFLCADVSREPELNKIWRRNSNSNSHADAVSQIMNGKSERKWIHYLAQPPQLWHQSKNTTGWSHRSVIGTPMSRSQILIHFKWFKIR